MIKKINLPVLVTGLCLLVAVTIGLFYVNQKKITPVTSNSETETNLARTDYTLVARKTLDWIDQQRNDHGWYILERGCDFEKKTCDTVWDNKEGNKGGLIATWARFNFYQQTKDPKDLAIVKSDINKFYEKYPNGVDNTLWICKITYDMWQSDLFDQEIKDKLEKICFSSEMNKLTTVPTEYRKEIEQEMYKLNQVEPWDTWKGYNLIRGTDNYFGLSSDFVSQYLWTKDESKLVLAKKYFESGKEIVEEQGSLVEAEDECLLGLSAIDLYEYGGKDENILNYVKERYMTFEAGEVKKYRTAICGLMTKRLYQVTENKTFLTGLENNNKVITNLLLDGEDSHVNKTGTYGFFITTYGGFVPLYKDIIENGLIVELLRN